MADNTKIEWADATVNADNGCSVLSPGCTNCYAMKLAGTRLKHVPSRAGLTVDSKTGPVWTGEVRLDEKQLLAPLRWKRPRRIFWNAHGDLFHDAVPDEWIDRVFAVCALTPQHTHMILTKRSARMREYLNNDFQQVRSQTWCNIEGLAITGKRQSEAAAEEAEEFVALSTSLWPLPNVWLGVSVEDQARADQRIPDLLATPAAVRFISVEPLLGPVDLRAPLYRGEAGITMKGYLRDKAEPDDFHYWASKLDWVIVGGESGPGSRPMHPDWACQLRDQCAAADVPFFFKQWGEWAPVCEMGEQLLDDIYHPAPVSHPDATRRCKVDQCVLHADGTRFDGDAMFRRPAFEQGSGAMTMFAVGKARAGRLLDGTEHNAIPERSDV